MNLMTFKPVVRRSLPAFQNDFDHLINTLIDGNLNRPVAKTPKVNIIETDEAFRLEIAAPGFDKKDFNVSVEDEVLSIEARHEANASEEKTNFVKREFHIQEFTRRFRLPETIDTEKINAQYADGILTITLEKVKEVTPELKKIEIS